jgi:hypothetical protein
MEVSFSFCKNKGSLFMRIQNTDIMVLVRDSPEYMTKVGVNMQPICGLVLNG